MNEMPPEVRALFFGLGTATVIAIILLVFGDRPYLAAWVRSWFGSLDMSSSTGAARTSAIVPPPEPSPAPIAQPDNNPTATTTTDRNALLLSGKVDAIAALVNAKLVGETIAIKTVFNVSPSSTNKLYQLVREMLHARLDRLQRAQPGTPRPLTPEQAALREELHLDD